MLLSAPTTVSGDDERVLWNEQIRAPWSDAGTIVRFSWLPAKLSAVASLIEGLRAHACRVETFTGRTIGAGLLRLDGEEPALAAAIGDLRSSTSIGHVVVLRATRRLKEQVDVWGQATGANEVARALKRKFDPEGILNAGRGPI